jgi:hypothetical protein
MNDFINVTVICVAPNGCTGRSYPAVFSPHTIYIRINRWAKNGCLEWIFLAPG